MTHTSVSPSATPMTWKFRPLVVAVLLLLLLYPYVEEHGLSLKALSSIVLLAGIYAVSRNKRFLLIACMIGLPTLISDVASFMTAHPFAEIVSRGGTVLFMGFTTAIILWHTLAEEAAITLDTLYGAVCVYLLSGLTWAALYTLIEEVQPGSFYISTAQNPDQVVNWSDLLYFSFATLTTLGYGDITPITSVARSPALLEAVFGVLYSAILIARFVGLYRPPGSLEP